MSPALTNYLSSWAHPLIRILRFNQLMNAESSPESASGDRDELFEVLAHRQRRRVLGVLRSAEGSLTLTEAALELARRSDEPVSEERVDRIRVSLHHWHLPKLAEAGLVEFDPGRGEVALAGSLREEAVEAALDVEVE